MRVQAALVGLGIASNCSNSSPSLTSKSEQQGKEGGIARQRRFRWLFTLLQLLKGSISGLGFCRQLGVCF